MPLARADELDARPADNAKELLALDVDALAQEIRRVDGSNSLGAGALAEELIPFIVSRISARQQASVEDVADFLDHCGALRIAGSVNDDESELARALLAKYDIFEKVSRP